MSAGRFFKNLWNLIRSIIGVIVGIIAYIVVLLGVFSFAGGTNVETIILTILAVAVLILSHKITHRDYRIEFDFSMPHGLFIIFVYFPLFPIFAIKYFFDPPQRSAPSHRQNSSSRPSTSSVSSNNSMSGAGVAADKTGGMKELKKRLGNLCYHYTQAEGQYTGYGSDNGIVSGGICKAEYRFCGTGGRDIVIDLTISCRVDPTCAGDLWVVKHSQENFWKFINAKAEQLQNEALSMIDELNYSDINGNWTVEIRCRNI